MKEELIFEIARTESSEKGTEKGTEIEGERNEAGTKTPFSEKERGRNEIVNIEERLIPW